MSREKILQMIDHVIAPFDSIIHNVAIADMDDVPEDLIPEPIKNLREFIKEKLTLNRAAYEDGIVNIVSEYLTDEDVDAVIAYYQSEASKKLNAASDKLRAGLAEFAWKWRNSSLEPYADEVKKVLGVVEPAPAQDLDAAPNGVPVDNPSS